MKSEHDIGFNLGINLALQEIAVAKSGATDTVETKREKEAIHKVCEILKIQLTKRLIP
jgi:hypothetical protein